MIEGNTRILQNTLILYFRMFLTVVVSLYTVRIVFNTLGAEDYGIFNVVAGVVTMFSFFSGTMVAASQRFFAFELGRKNFDKLRKIFSLTMTIYFLIAVVILFLAETIGLWFLNNKMSIPLDRVEAANWVYQLSILSFMMTMFTVPYNAAIIAHEKMSVYGYVSILEAFLKLTVVFFLTNSDIDKLKLYAFLMFCVTTLVTFIYRQYCVRSFSECRYFFYWDRVLFNSLINFAGWNVIGNIALVGREQGINVLLNLFFSPVVNAARGIAFQVTAVINSFVTNLQTAMNPHITKQYASKEISGFLSVISQGARFSFYLLLLLSLPVMLKTEFILKLWLGDIPAHTVNFVRIIIIVSLIDTLSRTIIVGILATGEIRGFQLIVGVLNLTILPISYFLFKNGARPELAFYVTLFISIVGILPRLYFLQRKVPIFSISKYVKEVILNVLFVTILSVLCPFALMLFVIKSDDLLSFLYIGLSSICSVTLFVYLVGLKTYERNFLNRRILMYFFKLLKAQP